jgi:hypothetical protein
MVQRLGAVDNLRNMVNILREVSFDEVRDDAMRQPSLLVVGPTETEARWFGELLVGEPGGTTPGRFRRLWLGLTSSTPLSFMTRVDPTRGVRSPTTSGRFRRRPRSCGCKRSPIISKPASTHSGWI